MKYNYIKANVNGSYATFDKPLNKDLYVIGSTYNDYKNNAWVPISTKQLNFKKLHPDASVEEVFNMKLFEVANAKTIETIRNEKIEHLKQYDKSNYVNMFFINDKPDWWDKNERMSIHQRLEVERTLGKPKTTFWFNNANLKFDLDFNTATDILLELDRYAIACYDNTNNHIFNIKQLKTIKEIDSYDFMTGYPEKIKLVL